LKIKNLDSKNANWKSLLDLIFVLPFVKTEDVVSTYEQQILRKYDEMKRTAEFPFGSRAVEAKVNQFLFYFEATWIGARTGLETRATGLYEIRRWNHFWDCVTGDALTNNSSEGMINDK